MINNQAEEEKILHINVKHTQGPCCELLAQQMTCAPIWELTGWEEHYTNPV